MLLQEETITKLIYLQPGSAFLYSDSCMQQRENYQYNLKTAENCIVQLKLTPTLNLPPFHFFVQTKISLKFPLFHRIRFLWKQTPASGSTKPQISFASDTFTEMNGHVPKVRRLKLTPIMKIYDIRKQAIKTWSKHCIKFHVKFFTLNEATENDLIRNLVDASGLENDDFKFVHRWVNLYNICELMWTALRRELGLYKPIYILHVGPISTPYLHC
jgi:hypothetical protein